MAELASDGGEAARAAGQASWLLDVELDTAWREAMIQKIRHVGQVCGEEETALIAKCCTLLDTAADTGTVHMLRRSPTVISAWTKRHKNSGLRIGRVELLVRAS